MPKALSGKEQAFVEHYLTHLDAKKAAIDAGYAESTATKKAYAWVGQSRSECPPHKRHLWDAVQAAMQARSERAQVDADYVLQRLMETDQMDIRDILNDDFTLKPLSEWPQVWRQNLSGFDVTELFEGSGDVKRLSGHLKKLKFPDKLKTLELLGKHIGVQAFKDKFEHEAAGSNVMLIPACASVDDWEKAAQEQQGKTLSSEK